MHSAHTPHSQSKQVRILTSKGRRHRSLQKILLRCTLTSDSPDQLFTSLVQVLTQHCQPCCILHYSRNQDNQLSDGRLLYNQSSSTLDSAILSQLKSVCLKCADSNEVEIQPYINIEFVLYAAPISIRGQEAETIGAVFPATDSTESYSLLLQMFVSHVVLWHVLNDSLKNEQQAHDSAAIVELLSGIALSATRSQANQYLANELADYLGCRQIAIGMKSGSNSCCQLVSISGGSDFDKASQSVETLESAMNETIQRSTTTSWSTEKNESTLDLVSLKTLGIQQNAQTILMVPFHSSDNETTGAFCVIDIAFDRMESTRCLLEAAATPLANSLNGIQQRSTRAQAWKSVISKRLCGRTGLLTAVTLFALASILFLPWPYQVSCECQVEPVMRRFVVAPFKGTLETLLVEPGDLVHQGDVLARMDPRELQWKRASLIADQKQAIKRRDSAQASREYATQQLSRLEAERLGLEIELLDHRINNLEIRSPVAGIVVSGTLNWAAGAPLEIGEAMFEIAPLEKMLVEIAVPDAEICHVTAGQSVQVQLDALPETDQKLSLDRIHPRSEIRDDANIFVADALLANSQGLLRPGMKGRARIQTARQPVYWILFHKPWNLLRKYLF
ncbi:HlyD family efflux transporter periplasmic adaptor subunit [Gimesia sp.]|uniref:efflux RND transporter periplasmic adaptor subunit n=1 Tax=Gimesia sp. TaxID=2024833 RepID=UPI0025BD859E|nr:HlyD family efflux transporter periplasmic adaptor subunit [Gimesia sp.]|tara:strand:+ start:8527 stop:10383 length:1857 start_codon:yes stop_codon:yes gene_type:complete